MSPLLPQLGDWTTFAELRHRQDQQLPDVMERASASPFYAERFRRERPAGTVEGFAGLPLTTKADLHDSYPFGMLAVEQERLSAYFESSGSAGRPTPAFYTARDWQDLGERYARKPCGILPSDVFLVRTPYALGLAGHLAQEAGRLRGATVIPGDNRSSVVPYSRVVRILHDLGVTLTWSNPTDCFMWAAAALRAGLDPRRDFPALRCLFVGGEALSPARRARLSEVWGVPVVDEYGCTEVGSLACRCPHDQMHFWADRVKPEVRDVRTGEVTSQGVGELVLTPLFLEAMPLLRYNVHDLVELRDEECACGWHLPVIRVLGRAAQGHPVRGATVSQDRLEQLVFSLPAELGVFFWRAQACPDELRIQVEVPDGNAATVQAALAERVHQEFHVPSAIEALPPGRLVPDDVLTSPRHSLKPRSLFGPDENWDSALLFSAR
jgi:phenylacetate-CoA ligase